MMKKNRQKMKEILIFVIYSKKLFHSFFFFTD